MLKYAVLGLVLAGLAAAPALAGECPTHVRKIDEALAKAPQLSADQLTKVRQLRAEGQTLHEARQHAQALAKLTEAEGILGIK